MKKFTFLFSILLIVCSTSKAQFNKFDSPFAHTFSIVAHDPVTGQMGVAVQSHWFSVGSVVAWGEAGVGVVATQSFVNVSFGIRGLELLKQGLSPQEAVDKLISEDNAPEVRQLAILDTKGRVATHTGSMCVKDAGHIQGDGYSCKANMMLNDKVWGAMSKGFENTDAPLAEKMMAALEAGQEVGGDIRGKQSCAILVVSGTNTGKPWEDRIIDLRIEDHAEPIVEMKRILKTYRAYEHMNNGDLAMEHGDMKKALDEYTSAEVMFPENLEMKYWHAVTLVNNGNLDEALPMFKEVFEKDHNWAIMTPRLIDSKLLDVTDEQLKQILSAGKKK